jgi:outer membrane protein TolC
MSWPLKLTLPALVVLTALAVFALFFKENARSPLKSAGAGESALRTPAQGTGSDAQERLNALRLQRKQTLQRIVDHTERTYETGQSGLAAVLRAKIALLTAESELCSTQDARIAIHQDIVELHRKIEEAMQRSMADGRVIAIELAHATVTRLDAEIDLAQAQLERAAP